MDSNKLLMTLFSKCNFPTGRSYHASSGSKDIDALISEIQSIKYQGKGSSRFSRNIKIFQWFPYKGLKFVKEIGKGGFGTVYHVLDNDVDYALKSLRGSGKLCKGFVESLKSYVSVDDFAIPRCYGITGNPETKEYMLVFQYANDGNLHQYLEKCVDVLTWADKKPIILEIAYGIKTIHDNDLVHGNLHPGNILRHVCQETGDQRIYISDLGMCNPVNERHTHEVYGVLPFVAPEVLQGSECTKASDIYSLAMLIWTVITGRKPYSDRPHDIYLTFEICLGLRPEIPRGTPRELSDLIIRCWDSDPTKRLNIHEIIFMLNWIPFSEGGPIELGTDPVPQHQNAIYISNLLYSCDTDKELRKLKEEGPGKSKEKGVKKDVEGDLEDFVIINLDEFEVKTQPIP